MKLTFLKNFKVFDFAPPPPPSWINWLVERHFRIMQLFYSSSKFHSGLNMHRWFLPKPVFIMMVTKMMILHLSCLSTNTLLYWYGVKNPWFSRWFIRFIIYCYPVLSFLLLFYIYMFCLPQWKPWLSPLSKHLFAQSYI